MADHSTERPTPGVARPLRLYFVGQGIILIGACTLNVSGSMLPMALAASAGLMLTVPLVRHLLRR